MNKKIISQQNTTVGNTTKPFDSLLPERLLSTSLQSNSISYVNSAGITKQIHLKGNNKYHRSILRGVYFGIQSDWYAELNEKSRPTYLDAVRKLFDWINDSRYKTKSNTRYKVLRAYEEYEQNDRGRKTSPLAIISTIVREGVIPPKNHWPNK